MKLFGWSMAIAMIVGLTGVSGAVEKRAVSSLGGVRPQALQAEPSAVPALEAATRAQVQASYGKLPLHFEANQG